MLSDHSAEMIWMKDKRGREISNGREEDRNKRKDIIEGNYLDHG